MTAKMTDLPTEELVALQQSLQDELQQRRQRPVGAPPDPADPGWRDDAPDPSMERAPEVAAPPAGHDLLLGRLKRLRERYRLKPWLSALGFLVVPLVAIQLIQHQYPLLESERFTSMYLWIIPTGLLLVVLALVQQRHPKGTRNRLLLDIGYVFATMAWLFGFLGGRTVLTQSFDGYEFSIDVTGVVVVLLAAYAINIVHDVAEFLFYRQRSRSAEIAAGA